MKNSDRSDHYPMEVRIELGPPIRHSNPRKRENQRTRRKGSNRRKSPFERRVLRDVSRFKRRVVESRTGSSWHIDKKLRSVSEPRWGWLVRSNVRVETSDPNREGLSVTGFPLSRRGLSFRPTTIVFLPLIYDPSLLVVYRWDCCEPNSFVLPDFFVGLLSLWKFPGSDTGCLVHSNRSRITRSGIYSHQSTKRLLGRSNTRQTQNLCNRLLSILT